MSQTLQVSQTITGILVHNLEVDPVAIEPNVLLADLGLDSLAIVEFGMIVSSTFGIIVEDDGLEDLTVADVITLVQTHMP
jgi:acyl carrier protein